MNLQDRFMEWFLAGFDRVLDFITFGKWSQVRGDEVVDLCVKE